jgi:hypothetical protein
LTRGGGSVSKDTGDAVAYLHRVVQQYRRAITYSRVEGWFQEFALGTPSRTVMANINAAYRAAHRSDGLVQG